MCRQASLFAVSAMTNNSQKTPQHQPEYIFDLKVSC